MVFEIRQVMRFIIIACGIQINYTRPFCFTYTCKFRNTVSECKKLDLGPILMTLTDITSKILLSGSHCGYVM